MSHLNAIIRKELRQYFNSPIAYIIAAVFVAASSALFFRGFFIAGQATMRGYFSLLPWLLLFLIPAIAMRLFAEERSRGTAELLATWPVRRGEIVAGKYAASMLLIAAILACTLVIPVGIARMGSLDWGVVAASYAGTLLLSAAFLAVCILLSSLTDNQIIAFVAGITACFVLYILGEPIVTYALPASLSFLAQQLSAGYHYASMARGVFDTRDLLYFGSVIALCLHLTARTSR